MELKNSMGRQAGCCRDLFEATCEAQEEEASVERSMQAVTLNGCMCVDDQRQSNRGICRDIS